MPFLDPEMLAELLDILDEVPRRILFERRGTIQQLSLAGDDGRSEADVRSRLP